MADTVTSTVQEALSEFNVRPDGDGADKDSGRLMYWRETETGQIIYASAHPGDLSRMLKFGYTPLYKYGTFRDVNGKDEGNWRPNVDPYRRILERGGEAEFTAEQVVQLGWDRKAPKLRNGRTVVFPQLADRETFIKKCPACRRTFSALTAEEVDAQLRKHESIGHRDVSQQQQLARVLAETTTEMHGPTAQVLKMLVDAQNAQAAAMTALMDKIAQMGAPAPAAKADEAKPDKK